MIYGLGIDIVKVSRIESAVGRWGDAFLRRIFTERELIYCFSQRVPFPSLAVRFAAKEAFVKASGAAEHCPLRDIEILNAESGMPFMNLYGRAKEFAREKEIHTVHVSLSHEREYGVASVILEGPSSGGP
ncbi:MAG: holo-ACP synthase [Thermodesulfovibrionales bacterium]